MSTNDTLESHSRREFLKRLGATGGAIGAGLAFNAHAGPTETQPAAAAPKKRGYRETAHVREYYAKAAL